MVNSKPRRRLARAVAAAILIAVLSLTPAAAQTTVTFQIAATGPLRAGVSVDSPFGPIVFSDSIQHDSALIRLVVSDRRGTSAGWSIVIASTDFVYGGDSRGGIDLPNRGFRIVAAGAPVLIAGAKRGDGGPNSLALPGAGLNASRRTLWAGAGWGSGDYAQPIGLSLTIPARSQPGPYVATMTIAIVIGP